MKQKIILAVSILAGVIAFWLTIIIYPLFGNWDTLVGGK